MMGEMVSGGPIGSSCKQNPVGLAVGLSNGESARRLNQIDRVRAYGVSDHISLPQIVVCGDQSAGKSSVLEGITGFPLPRREGLCTQFPIEIILRHKPTSFSITATIHPHASRQNVEERILNFRKRLDGFQELEDTVKEAAMSLNLRGPDRPDGPLFTRDVLRLEVVGDTGLNLTIVDLPGLIAVSEEEEDVNLVEQLTAGYIQSPRTIILAVVQAGSDVVTQGILQRARRHDVSGERTVGVITKPDLINEGTEASVAMLARNMHQTRLKLGFFLLKNPSPKQIEEGLTLAQRAAAEEEFFQSRDWRDLQLDYSRVGVANLRIFLQGLLSDHVERELPQVCQEVRVLKRRTEATLDDMGPPRISLDQARLFLTKISMKVSNLIHAASEGIYDGEYSEFFKSPISEKPARLRAAIHKRNGDFSTHMRDKAAKRKLSDGLEPKRVEQKGSKGQQKVTRRELIDWIKSVRPLSKTELNTEVKCR